MVPKKKFPWSFFINLASCQKSCTWKDIESILSELKIRKGSEYYLKACKYLEIGLEQIPKVLSPGNKLSMDKMNELASDEVCANTTILFWYSKAFQMSYKLLTPKLAIIFLTLHPMYKSGICTCGHTYLKFLFILSYAYLTIWKLVKSLKNDWVAFCSFNFIY